jgi:hypothetical protein
MIKIISRIPQKLAAIKVKASDRILEKFPYWKQHNMNMAATALVNKKVDAILAHLSLDPLTAEEKALEAQLLAISAKIQAVRARSNELEVNVASHVAVDENDDNEWPAL